MLVLCALQEAGWGVDSMARSAELLKCTWPGWNAELEGRFLSWVNRLIMPQLNHEMLERLPLANWQTTVAGTCAFLLGVPPDTYLLHGSQRRQHGALKALDTSQCTEVDQRLQPMRWLGSLCFLPAQQE
jgi:hypothetical protein